MKFVLIAALSVFAMSSYADSLKDMKSKANDDITQKISSLESAKGCVNGAQTKEAFKACNYDLNKSMDMQKEETKEDLKDEMDEDKIED